MCTGAPAEAAGTQQPAEAPQRAFPAAAPFLWFGFSFFAASVCGVCRGSRRGVSQGSPQCSPKAQLGVVPVSPQAPAQLPGDDAAGHEG